jgi:pyruvate dehydrogenase phosphatase
MRSAAARALRLRRSTLRKLLASKNPWSTARDALNPRLCSSLVRRYSTGPAPLQSSMRIPKIPLAFVSTLGAIGAWYAYRGDGTQHLLQKPDLLSTTPQTRGLSTAPNTFSEATAASQSQVSAVSPAENTRRALVVDNDQFYTGQIVGEEPLSKDTDDYGRKVLEMMTPEQATERLRKTEESFLVGRGRGVVRYDVVTLPSNDPIEDDHAEKIVEVPNSVADVLGRLRWPLRLDDLCQTPATPYLLRRAGIE